MEDGKGCPTPVSSVDRRWDSLWDHRLVSSTSLPRTLGSLRNTLGNGSLTQTVNLIPAHHFRQPVLLPTFGWGGERAPEFSVLGEAIVPP